MYVTYTLDVQRTENYYIYMYIYLWELLNILNFLRIHHSHMLWMQIFVLPAGLLHKSDNFLAVELPDRHSASHPFREKKAIIYSSLIEGILMWFSLCKWQLFVFRHVAGVNGLNCGHYSSRLSRTIWLIRIYICIFGMQ